MLRNILHEWKQETGGYTIIESYYKYEEKDNTLTIYTTHPGWFIGAHGKLIEKYKKKLSDSLTHNSDKELTINFVDLFKCEF